jgi:hypothetical protein
MIGFDSVAGLKRLSTKMTMRSCGDYLLSLCFVASTVKKFLLSKALGGVFTPLKFSSVLACVFVASSVERQL